MTSQEFTIFKYVKKCAILWLRYVPHYNSTLQAWYSQWCVTFTCISFPASTRISREKIPHLNSCVNHPAHDNFNKIKSKEIRTAENYIAHNLVKPYITLKSKHEENNLYPRHKIRTWRQKPSPVRQHQEFRMDGRFSYVFLFVLCMKVLKGMHINGWCLSSCQFSPITFEA
jgi:hypothetical protein